MKDKIIALMEKYHDKGNDFVAEKIFEMFIDESIAMDEMLRKGIAIEVTPEMINKTFLLSTKSLYVK